MHREVVALALVACCGCQGGIPASQRAESSPGASAGLASALVGRAWARSDSTGLPGVMRIFLEDGTLVMDSCWETYQLARWRMESDSVVAWQEGGADVRAAILSVDADSLVLRVRLVDQSQDEHFHTAQVPYVCPDMRR